MAKRQEVLLQACKAVHERNAGAGDGSSPQWPPAGTDPKQKPPLTQTSATTKHLGTSNFLQGFPLGFKGLLPARLPNPAFSKSPATT